MLTVRHFVDGAWTTVPAGGFDPAAPPDDGWLWIDVFAPGGRGAEVLDELGLHPLVIEDMRDDQHLPKVEVVDGQLSLTVHGLHLRGREDGATRAEVEVDTAELDAAMDERVLITYHEREMASLDAVGSHLDRGDATGLDRPVLLLHRILDTLNDVLVPFVDFFEQRLDIIEADLLSTPTDATRDDLYRLQRDVIQLRRVVVPQAEVLRRLEREASTLMAARFRPSDLALFRDVHDHLYRMTELSESYRQLVDSAMASYRAAQDDELNDMLRVLTLVSALLLPISVIAGIYGTNFVNVPELEWQWGYFGMLGLFVVIILGMLSWFRSRGWIGRVADREASQRRARLADTLDVPVLGSVLKVPVAGARVLGRSTHRVLHPRRTLRAWRER